MGIFDFLKTEEEKEEDELLKIFERVRAKNEAADEMLAASPHNNSVVNGQISTAVGRFGLDATNPIPVKGFSGISDYFYKLDIRKKFPTYEDCRRGSTSAENIDGNIDIYVLTARDGSSLEPLYISMYCNETSSKIPDGFNLDNRTSV